MKKIERIKEVKELQRKALGTDYNIALYNGLELALSILENREPEYKRA